MKLGFSLLEVLIATALASVLSGALFVSFGMINRGYQSSENAINRDTRQMLFFQQFQRDITGAFVPFIMQEPQSQPADQKQPAKAVLKPLDKAFYGEVKDNRLAVLTFITNTPLPAYQTPKARLARIYYRLEQDENRKNSFMLTRQEVGDILQPVTDQGASTKKYELISGVKDIAIDFLVTVSAQGNEKPEIKKFNQWPVGGQNEQGLPLKPDTVKVRLSLWDDTFKKNYDTNFTFPLLVIDEEPVQTSTQQAVQQSDQKSPGQAPKPAAPAQQGQRPPAPAGARPPLNQKPGAAPQIPGLSTGRPSR